ncbi:F-box/WD repeat-containing protein 9-like isoform X2 [Tachypleus tridentatus]|uniref:F-box/WD repeat-containing protein 9-like isoform X2 n=1 Tax=Tachypleus tridentatus TaxID=6853 RepID=UPI003FD11634
MSSTCRKKESTAISQQQAAKITELKLDTIPLELFMLICSYLDAKFVIHTLGQVCHLFHDCIQDDLIWKMRISKRWPKRYPLVEASSSFNWKKACIEREEHWRLWKDWKNNMKFYCFSGAHYAAVDATHIFQDGTTCASGSRDHCLKIWNLKNLDCVTQGSEADFLPCLSLVKVDAHTGWIWDIISSGHTLYSSSWDGLVKAWDVQRNCNEIACNKWSAAVLSLAVHQDMLVAGTFDRKVRMMDPRVGLKFVGEHSIHKKPVLCMEVNSKFIISGSEDETVVIFDRIAGKVHSIIKFEEFPMCLSYRHGQLWIGDKQGWIHLIDPTNEKFEIVQSYHTGHSGKITGIQYSLGSIITSSTDRTIRVLEPCANPEVIAVLPGCGEVTGVSLHNHTLLSADSDNSIYIWTPVAE